MSTPTTDMTVAVGQLLQQMRAQQQHASSHPPANPSSSAAIAVPSADGGVADTLRDDEPRDTLSGDAARHPHSSGAPPPPERHHPHRHSEFSSTFAELQQEVTNLRIALANADQALRQERDKHQQTRELLRLALRPTADETFQSPSQGQRGRGGQSSANDRSSHRADSADRRSMHRSGAARHQVGSSGELIDGPMPFDPTADAAEDEEGDVGVGAARRTSHGIANAATSQLMLNLLGRVVGSDSSHVGGRHSPRRGSTAGGPLANSFVPHFVRSAGSSSRIIDPSWGESPRPATTTGGAAGHHTPRSRRSVTPSRAGGGSRSAASFPLVFGGRSPRFTAIALNGDHCTLQSRYGGNTYTAENTPTPRRSPLRTLTPPSSRRGHPAGGANPASDVHGGGTSPRPHDSVVPHSSTKVAQAYSNAPLPEDASMFVSANRRMPPPAAVADTTNVAAVTYRSSAVAPGTGAGDGGGPTRTAEIAAWVRGLESASSPGRH